MSEEEEEEEFLVLTAHTVYGMRRSCAAIPGLATKLSTSQSFSTLALLPLFFEA